MAPAASGAAVSAPDAISVSVAPAASGSPNATRLSGTLLDGAGAPLAGAVVELQQDPYPYRGFFDAGHATTAADGSFEFAQLRPDRNTRYRVSANANATVSRAVTIYVGAPAVLRSYPRGAGRVVLTLTAHHSAYFHWAGLRAYWFVGARPGGPLRLATVTRTQERAPGVTFATATIDPPAARFVYRVCLQGAVGGAGPPADHSPCPRGTIAYQAGGRGTPSPPFPSARGIAAAVNFLDRRAGVGAFAVIDNKGTLSGVRVHRRFNSASLVKAMLLVAYLERLERVHRALGPADRQLLYPMIHVSDNGAASTVYAIVGPQGLRRLAARVGMTDFAISAGWWGLTQISAADQARFFFDIDRLLAPSFFAYARELLAGIAGAQSWGIPAAGRPVFRVYFKGGWLPSQGLVNQAARIERGRAGFALAVLTSAAPPMSYGEQTIEGVAARLLGPPPLPTS